VKGTPYYITASQITQKCNRLMKASKDYPVDHSIFMTFGMRQNFVFGSGWGQKTRGWVDYKGAQENILE
jgi:hypothetical protein